MTLSLPPASDLASVIALEELKPDAFIAPSLPTEWGRIYGGQVVAQALRAACLTVGAEQLPHSLHAYFIRQGDSTKPVLLEVQRVRDGRSFSTRQVVAYQPGGAILNEIVSFKRPEADADVHATRAPVGVPDAADVAPAEGQTLFHERRELPRTLEPQPHGYSWLWIPEALPDDPVVHACGLAWLSDDDAMSFAMGAHPCIDQWKEVMNASLDHALWIHRPLRADEPLLFEGFGGGVFDARGLGILRVFQDGVHVASVAQEGLMRLPR